MALITPITINSTTEWGIREFYSHIWSKVWRERKHDEWQTLGRKYGFRLASAPPDAPLDLPVVLPGPYWSLYEILEVEPINW